MAGALEGIRIVDLTNIILGPYGTMLLADQGADVIKVEAPEGDAVRHIGKPGKTPGMGPTYLYVNRNKRSLCLDLKDKAARAALLKVVEGADAFVHALRPQAIEGLGLGYEAIRKIKPDIVYVGAYGYSADGPYGKLPAYDDAIQARFGIADLMGRAAGDDIPRYPPTILADKTVGLTFAFSTLSALMHRQRTGEGQFVEVPMFETMAAWLMVEHLWERTFSDQGEVGYTRLLARTRKPFRTLDGWMAILPYNDKHWSNFFEIVGRPEVLKDPRYSTLNARSLHINDMYAMVEALAPSRTTAEWVQAPGQGADPQRAGVASGRPVRRPAPRLAPALQEVPASQRGRDHDGRAADAHEPHPARHPHHGAAAGRRFAVGAGGSRRERGRDRGAEDVRRAYRAVTASSAAARSSSAAPTDLNRVMLVASPGSRPACWPRASSNRSPITSSSSSVPLASGWTMSPPSFRAPARVST